MNSMQQNHLPLLASRATALTLRALLKLQSDTKVTANIDAAIEAIPEPDIVPLLPSRFVQQR